jgi:hypothetical protein
MLNAPAVPSEMFELQAMCFRSWQVPQLGAVPQRAEGGTNHVVRLNASTRMGAHLWCLPATGSPVPVRL